MPGQVGPEGEGGEGGGITGSGTVNTLAKFTNTDEVGDSRITDDGTDINIGDALTSKGLLKLVNTANSGRRISSYVEDVVDGSHFAEAAVEANGDAATAVIYADSAEVNINGSRDEVSFVCTRMGFYDKTNVARPQVAASPTAQGIVDALVALGLITQAS